MADELQLYDVFRQLIEDCQTGFFFYTLIYLSLRMAKRGKKLREFDDSATVVICGVSGLLFAVLAAEITYGWNISAENQNAMYSRMAGRYAFGFWIPIGLYTLVPQLLWIRNVREHWFSRLLIAFLLFFNFEKYVILVTSFHRDYLGSSQFMFSDWDIALIAFGAASKLVLFAGLASLLYALRRKAGNPGT